MNTLEIKLESLISGLAGEGYAALPEFLNAYEIAAMLAHAQTAHAEGRFGLARVGSGADLQRAEKIRGDLSLWIDEWNEPALFPLGEIVKNLTTAVRRELFLPVHDFEAHFALYPPGAGYKAHLDQHQGNEARVISMVLYLSDLDQGDGGELVLHNTRSQKNTEILIRPQAGTLVAFLSGLVVHEVRATLRERWSLTGWLRQRRRGAVAEVI